MENIEQEKNAVVDPEITLEGLRHTSMSLEKLASPDREIDVMAKLAVLMDMGLEKEAGSKIKKFVNETRRAVWDAQDMERAADNTIKAKNIAKRTDQKLKGRTLGDYKWPIVAGAGTLGAYYLGSKKSESSKKDELRNVARKYFSLGQKSA
jgi:hypothetical protein